MIHCIVIFCNFTRYLTISPIAHLPNFIEPQFQKQWALQLFDLLQCISTTIKKGVSSFVKIDYKTWCVGNVSMESRNMLFWLKIGPNMSCSAILRLKTLISRCSSSLLVPNLLWSYAEKSAGLFLIFLWLLLRI